MKKWGFYLVVLLLLFLGIKLGLLWEVYLFLTDWYILGIFLGIFSLAVIYDRWHKVDFRESFTNNLHAVAITFFILTLWTAIIDVLPVARFDGFSFVSLGDLIIVAVVVVPLIYARKLPVRKQKIWLMASVILNILIGASYHFDIL